MKKVNLHICDPDELYLTRLDGFIQHRERSPFNVMTYTTVDSVCQAAETDGILLLNSDLYETVVQRIVSGDMDMIWHRIIVLNEGNFDWKQAREAACGLDIETAIIDKYQSAGQLYAFLLDTCIDPAQQLYSKGASAKDKCSVQLLGVYAPGDYAGRETFALELAKKQTPGCLYISFEELSENVPIGRSLSDMVVAIKERQDGIAENMGKYLICEDGLDILPPAACPYDIGEVGEDDWLYWFEQLILHGKYNTIVINFGSSLPSIALMELCTKVYLPYTQLTESKSRRFESLLDFMGKKDVLSKLEFKLTGGVRHGIL